MVVVVETVRRVVSTIMMDTWTSTGRTLPSLVMPDIASKNEGHTCSQKW